MKDFRQLRVWDKAHRLTLAIYPATAKFPAEERYGLTAQLRRCSASIGANIAEGCGRSGDGNFQRFLDVAMGSANELDYHLLLARDLKYLEATAYEQLNRQSFEVKRMLSTLIRKVSTDRRG
ncbi:MAG TPA: four helix bundle protein [Terriglobales bacterium]|nr:four helix bundle protein [Terriglobales bacterium]